MSEDCDAIAVAADALYGQRRHRAKDRNEQVEGIFGNER